MTSLAIFAITWYAGQYVGEPLYCGGYYDATQPPWAAAPLDRGWECGDVAHVRIDGVLYEYEILDFGPFGDNCVMQLDGTCPPIGLDIPRMHAPFDGLSTVGQVWNQSAREREWERWGQERVR